MVDLTLLDSLSCCSEYSVSELTHEHNQQIDGAGFEYELASRGICTDNSIARALTLGLSKPKPEFIQPEARSLAHLAMDSPQCLAGIRNVAAKELLYL